MTIIFSKKDLLSLVEKELISRGYSRSQIDSMDIKWGLRYYIYGPEADFSHLEITIKENL